MKVRPLKLADQALYTAALEYNNLPMPEIHESEFFQDQLALRKYYFNFSPSPELQIEHTAKGTVITLTKDTNENVLTMAEVCPTAENPVRFRLHTGLGRSHAHGRIMVGGYYKTILYNNTLYCGREVEEGSIMVTDNDLITDVGHGNRMHVPVQNEDTCVICIFISGTANTRIVVRRL